MAPEFDVQWAMGTRVGDINAQDHSESKFEIAFKEKCLIWRTVKGPKGQLTEKI
jgi:hypothetical protein